MKKAIITIIEILVIISGVYQFFSISYNNIINDINPTTWQLFVFICTILSSIFALASIKSKLDKIAAEEEGNI